MVPLVVDSHTRAMGFGSDSQRDHGQTEAIQLRVAGGCARLAGYAQQLWMWLLVAARFQHASEWLREDECLLPLELRRCHGS